MKRRQRAGLPLYPQELHQQHQQPPQQVQEQDQIAHNAHSSSSNSFSSLLSQNKANLSLYNNFSHHAINQIKYNVTGGGGSFGLPINSRVSHLSQNVAHALPIIPSFQYYPGGTFGTLSSMLTWPPYDPVGPLMAPELPSTQTPASSDASGVGGDQGLIGRTEISSSTTAHDQCYDFVSHESRLGNSGLLDDLLVEARTLSRNDKAKQPNGVSYDEEEEEEKGKSVAGEESVDEDGDGFPSESVLKNSGESITTGGDDENRTENFSSCDQSSTGT